MDDSMHVEGEGMSYEDKLKFVNVISQPMASRKLTSRVHKLMKKAHKVDKHLRQGLKEVQKSIRKGEKGLVILAGDVSPLDIMVHLPGMCEERDLPYVYVPSKQDLGTVLGYNRAALAMLIREHDSYQEDYDKVQKEINKLHPVANVA